MTSNRREYLKRTRKARRLEQKPSVHGICAMFLAFASAAVLVVSIVLSFLANGQGSYEVGSLGIISFLGAIAVLVLAYRSLHTPGIRPLPAKIGGILGFVLVVILVILYVTGMLAS